jgi:hypothetical protein
MELLMKSKHSILVLLLANLIPFVFLLITCTATEPEANQTGRRDYTWITDTLSIPYNYITRCWGNNPSDIWAIGDGDLDKTIYHFDGKKWYTDGKPRPIAPKSVFGFSKNNVWIGGMDGKIWKYDGSNWSEYCKFDTIPGYSHTLDFYDMYGDSPDNIYAVGSAWGESTSTEVKVLGLIFHFNGSLWSRVEIPNNNYILDTIDKDDRKNKYYIFALKREPLAGDTCKVLEFDVTNIRQIFSAHDNMEQGVVIFKIGDEVYFEFGGITYSYQNGKFIEVLHIHNEQNVNFSFSMYGRSINDIFIGKQDGVAHYNGTDVQYLLHFMGPKLFITNRVFFEKDIFLITHDYYGTGNHIIFHGKLN